MKILKNNPKTINEKLVEEMNYLFCPTKKCVLIDFSCHYHQLGK